MTRRSFLGAAGAGALAPLLRPFGRAFAQGATPRRIVFIYSANGTVGGNFWPDGDDITAKPILQPLAPHKADLLLVKNLGYAGFNVPHEMGTMKALTNYDAFDARPAGSERRKMYGPSLDEVLSKSVGAKTLRPILRMGPGWGNGRGWLMFDETGNPINPLGGSDKAFEYLFGGATSTPTAMPDPKLQALREVRKSVLDVISRDATALKTRLPKVQAAKMDAALASIRELERTLLAQGGSATAAAPIQCKSPVAPTDDTEHKKQASVIANAFACDVTRVVTWKLIGSADGGVPGFSGSFHNTSHEQGSADADMKLTYAHSYFAQQIAYLVTRLKATKDPLGTGSVFDNSVLYWCNECGHGNHGPGNLPIALLGSAGGFFKPGRMITLPKEESSKYGNLLVSLANAAGDPMPTFGDKRWCTGPLAALRG